MTDEAQTKDPDDLEQVRFSDMVDTRDDIRHLREAYKDAKRNAENVTSVKELLPLTPGNDLGYIHAADVERAEWFAEIWRKEGEQRIHPRGMHYQILGKGYERPRKDEPYQNNSASWNDMADGAFYAQVLGLVPTEMIQDEKNPDPRDVVEPDEDSPFSHVHRPPKTGFKDAKIPSGGIYDALRTPELKYDDVDELIQEEAKKTAREAFRGVRFDALRHQEYYVEIWAEKSGVIPEDLAEEYGCVLRPAGGGEMSYTMCQDAIRRAEERGQNLAVILISDFDPKGRDMPKSVARKLEVEASVHEEMELRVHHAAITKEQVEEYALPTEPAKDPEGTGTGAKAYESHKEKFREYAGSYSVEIQAFSGRQPDAFRSEIERFVRPYYEKGLDDRIRSAVNEAQQELEDELVERLEAKRDELEDAMEQAREACEDYDDELGEQFEEAKDALQELHERNDEVKASTGLEEARETLAAAVDIELADLPEEIGVEVPSGKVDNHVLKEPLLDTQRPFAEQLEAFKDFDIRG